MKKLLSLVGLLAISTPISLNVVICNSQESVVSEEENVTEIINGFNYTNDFLKLNSQNEIYNKNHNESFVRSQLINDVFDVLFSLTSFNSNKTIIDGNDASKSDLITHSLATKSNLDYKKIANRTVKLTISLKELAIITDAINNVKTYELEYLPENTTMDDLKVQIDSNFIKNQLEKNIQEIFVEDFVLSQITNDKDVPLTNEDLIEPGVINAKIKYYYGTFSDQTANLTIKSKEMLLQKYDKAQEDTILL